MGILTWIIFGLIAGAIAKAIHPGKDPGGWLVTINYGDCRRFYRWCNRNICPRLG